MLPVSVSLRLESRFFPPHLTFFLLCGLSLIKTVPELCVAPPIVTHPVPPATGVVFRAHYPVVSQTWEFGEGRIVVTP